MQQVEQSYRPKLHPGVSTSDGLAPAGLDQAPQLLHSLDSCTHALVHVAPTWLDLAPERAQGFRTLVARAQWAPPRAAAAPTSRGPALRSGRGACRQRADAPWSALRSLGASFVRGTSGAPQSRCGAGRAPGLPAACGPDRMTSCPAGRLVRPCVPGTARATLWGVAAGRGA